MSGNTFGRYFRVTTFGESHGPAIGGIIDGCPAGLSLCEEDFIPEMAKRRPGASHFTSQRNESDKVQILSGVFEGRTTGTPIGLLIQNEDARNKDYDDVKNCFRPGHADYTYKHKYGVYDYRGGGRASARETAVRVAAGVIASRYLQQVCNTSIRGYLAQMGRIKSEHFDWQTIDSNDFYFPDASKVDSLAALIKQLRRDGDSIGARVNVVAENVPRGLGAPVFQRLDAEIASALMSINAVKAVEIGDGFSVVEQRGSEHRDALSSNGFASNHSGGILGGISTGQSIHVSMAVKPTSSIRIPIETITHSGESTIIQNEGRHDPCVGIRAVPIARAMVALVLIDHLLQQRAQNPEVFAQFSNEVFCE